LDTQEGIMADEKTKEILKHTFNELERIISDEQEETGADAPEADKEGMIRRQAEEWKSELE